MDNTTGQSLEALNEALPMMLQELITLAADGKIDLAHGTANVILVEIGAVIDFASKALEAMKDH